MENREGRPELPVWETIKQSVVFPLTHLRALVRLGWPLAVIEGAMMMVYTPSFHWRMQNVTPAWVVWAGMLIQGAVVISWGVAWMRLVLTSSSSEVKLRFGRREWKYARIGVGLMVAAVVSVVLLVAAAIAVMLGLLFIFSGGGGSPNHLRLWLSIFVISAVVVLAFLIVWLRLGLVFPAIALDEYRGLRQSWRDTRGNLWRIAVVFYLLMLGGGLFYLPLVGAAFVSFRAALIVGAALGCTVMVVVSAIIHTAWALMYRRLTPEEPPALAAAQAR